LLLGVYVAWTQRHSHQSAIRVMLRFDIPADPDADADADCSTYYGEDDTPHGIVNIAVLLVAAAIAVTTLVD